MTIITQTTDLVAGVAMPSRQFVLANVRDAFLGGHAGVLAVLGDATTAGAGTDGITAGGFGFRGSRLPLMVPESVWTVIGDATSNGSGLPAEPELALERGKPMAEHAAATRRRYGASGECPRKIPA